MNDQANLLPEFDPSVDLPEHFLMLVYGLRRSGKTVWTKWVLERMKERIQYHEAYVICGTLDVNSEQYAFVPKAAQFSDVENLDYRLRTIVDMQKERVKRHKEARGGKMEFKKLCEKKGGSDSEESSDEEQENVLQHESKSRKAAKKEIVDPDEYKDSDVKPILIIMDDCVNENSVRTSPYLRLLAIGGRHIMISCIILSQVVAGSASVPPSVRTQADTICIIAQPRSKIERDLIAEQYLCASNESNAKTVGLQLMNKVTEQEHRGLVISTVSPSSRSYIDYCFKTGPSPYPPAPEDFKIGTEEQWAFTMKTKKPKTKHMPNPMSATPELPQHPRTGEYLRSQTDDIFW
jgi:hypothetical protein